jgi:hypothetical protein
MQNLSRAALLTRIRVWTLLFMAGLFISGLTAIPLRSEMDLLVRFFARTDSTSSLETWLMRVQTAIDEVSDRWPFLALGTDWLAFGHIVIGLGFIGLLRDPVRNQWLITWGMLACLMVVPWAWGFGWARHIPWGWRLVDSSFGVGGLVPLLLIRRYVRELESRDQLGFRK